MWQMRLFIIGLFFSCFVQQVTALPDLDVAFISRTPRYDRYNVSYQYGIDPNDYWTGKPYLTAAEKNKQRWPAPGSTVTFTAIIKNPSSSATGTFTYKWYMDGIMVKSGSLSSIASGGQTSTSYSWTWDSEQNTHYIKFVADPDNLITEEIESNNSREDPTNALSLRFHVWQSLYDWFRTNARNYAPEIASWDDWAQQQIYWMNRMLSEARFPHLPQGCPERVRLDDIYIEADSTPDPGGTHAPEDIQWDGRWGFTNGYLGPPNFYATNPDVLRTYEGSLIHELSHQIGLIDLYVLNIENGANHVVSTINHPNTREGGMMTGSYSRYSDHSAYGLTSHLHKRRGFYGEYLYDVPQTCRVRVLDAYYRPVAGASLSFYQDKNREFNSPPTFTLTTDSAGYVTLPNRTCYGSITTATGHTLHDNPWGLINVVGANSVFFVKVEAAGQTDYQFVEILPFNIAYRAGFTDSYTYDLQTSIIPEGRPVTGDLNGIKMTSPSHGYAVGAGGKILSWDGTTWSTMTSPTTSDLYAVDALSSTGTAVAVGDSGIVLIYSDGVWTKKSIGTTANLRACAMASSSIILVGGQSGVLYRSTNGGSTWTRLYYTSSNIRSIRFADSSRGIFVGEGPSAYYTVNGGASWAAASGYGGNWLIDCSFPSATEAWACNNNGGILKSTDGGRTWTKVYDFGYPEPWYAIDMLAGTNGWVAGRYHSFYNTTTIKRFENGQHYNQALVTYSPMDSVYDISVVSKNEAWAVGKNGLLLHLIGQNVDSYTPVTSIGESKNTLPDGTGVILSNAVATAGFPGEVYIEQHDQSSAIKMLTSKTPARLSLVRATGVLDTENGERIIRYGDLTEYGSDPSFGALGIIGRSLSGRTGLTGTNNTGMLVRTGGIVTAHGDNWFTIDDGSLITDKDGNRGIRVRCDGITPPASGFRVVTGISTFSLLDGVKFPEIRVRDSDDIGLP